MKLSRAAIALYVGLVFASGGVLGWFGQKLYHESTVAPKQAKMDPAQFRKLLIDEYNRRLTLSQDQITKLGIILDDTRAQFDVVNQREKQEVREKEAPEFQRIRQGQIERIQEMLSPQQRLEYEKMRADREKQREQQKKDGGIRRGPGI